MPERPLIMSGYLVPRALREYYFRSPVSRWRLRRAAGGRIDQTIPDVWPGSGDAGRSIVNGDFVLDGAGLGATRAIWDRLPRSEAHTVYLHGFGWLRDLRDMGGEVSRQTARTLVGGWMDRHDRWHPVLWRPDVLGQRLAVWVGTYSLLFEAAPDAFRERLDACVARQAAHAARDLAAAPAGACRLLALHGLAVAAIALGRRDYLDRVEHQLLRELPGQVLADGGHVSRSPARHCDALMALIGLRDAFRFAGRKLPPSLPDTIDRMASMLRLWRHPDGGLALFNRSVQCDPELMKSILKRAESRRKAARQAPDSGFCRIAAGRSCVIVDTGAPASTEGCAHAAPLAFEFSVGRQRLIVNCGTSRNDQRWARLLRASAAHSTLIVDEANAVNVSADGKSGPGSVLVTWEPGQDGAGVFLDAEHDGYHQRYGFMHQRMLHLSDSGDTLTGIDRIAYTGEPGRQANHAVLRFHLHPRVSASLTANRGSALLLVTPGVAWRMRADCPLALNESVYFGSGARELTKQIVLEAPLRHIREVREIAIRWTFARETPGDGRSARTGAASAGEEEPSLWSR